MIIALFILSLVSVQGREARETKRRMMEEDD